MDNEVQVVGTTTEEIAPSVSSEKTLSIDEVNRIVGREKAAASEKTRRQVEAEYAAKAAGNNSTGIVDSEKIVEEATRRLEAKLQLEQEKALESQQKAAWKGVTDEYNKRLAETAEAKEYEDFEEVARRFNHAKYNNVIYQATQLPNTSDVMYELFKKKAKAASLELLAQHDPEGFEEEMKNLSDSIKRNKDAAKTVSKASEPLSRLKPSTTGAEASDSDDYLTLKRSSRYRG